MTKKLVPNKTSIAKIPAPTNYDTGTGLYALAKAIEGVGEELQPLYKIEDLNDRLNDIASALYELARASQMGLIAQYGGEEDREIALKYLKGHFDGYFPSK